MSFTYERTSAADGTGPGSAGESADQTVFRKARPGGAAVPFPLPSPRRPAGCGPAPRDPSRKVTGPRATPRPQLEFHGVTVMPPEASSTTTAPPTAPPLQPTPPSPGPYPSLGGYTTTELADRIGVPVPTLASWIAACASSAPSTPHVPGCTSIAGYRFRAADVVWFETLARLVRSGTPVARAVTQLRAARSGADSPYPDLADLPNPG